MVLKCLGIGRLVSALALMCIASNVFAEQAAHDE